MIKQSRRYEMEEKPKRKTKTSSVVKDRYNKKVYEQIAVRVPKEMATEFKTKCEREGISQAQVIKDAIKSFMEK